MVAGAPPSGAIVLSGARHFIHPFIIHSWLARFRSLLAVNVVPEHVPTFDSTRWNPVEGFSLKQPCVQQSHSGLFPGSGSTDDSQECKI